VADRARDPARSLEHGGWIGIAGVEDTGRLPVGDQPDELADVGGSGRVEVVRAT
jgi:hypothetical protein